MERSNNHLTQTWGGSINNTMTVIHISYNGWMLDVGMLAVSIVADDVFSVGYMSHGLKDYKKKFYWSLEYKERWDVPKVGWSTAPK